MVSAGDGQRLQDLAPAAAQGDAADQGERHVRAEFGGELQQHLGGRAQLPQGVAGDQRGRAVRAAAGHAAGHRDGLGDVQVDVGRGEAVVGGEQSGGAGGEVAVVQRHGVGVRPGAAEGDARTGFAGRRGHLVAEGDREEDVGQVVEAVGAQSADPELDVDLGGHAYRDGHWETLTPACVRRWRRTARR